MKNSDTNSTSRTVLIFGFAAAALFLLIFATMVEMPLRALLIAIAVSDMIFLLVATLGDKLPGGKK